MIAITNYCNPKDVALIVKSMGATPILVDRGTFKNIVIDDFLTKIRALVIMGGEDINPKCYNQESNGSSPHHNDDRDIFEIVLARKAASYGIKVLGICRGHQILNVAFGGNLTQDIYSQGFPNHKHIHLVNIGGGFVTELFKKPSILVNSYHHQAVNKVAPGFEICGYSEDGVPEIIYNREINALGVQWHPEWMEDTREVFEWLIN